MNPKMNPIALYFCVELECTSSKHVFFRLLVVIPIDAPHWATHQGTQQAQDGSRCQRWNCRHHRGKGNRQQEAKTRDQGGQASMGNAIKHFWSLEAKNLGVYPKKTGSHLQSGEFFPRFLFTVNGDPTPAETTCLGTIRHTRSTFRKGGDRGDTQDGTKECSNGIRQIGLNFLHVLFWWKETLSFSMENTWDWMEISGNLGDQYMM